MLRGKWIFVMAILLLTMGLMAACSDADEGTAPPTDGEVEQKNPPGQKDTEKETNKEAPVEEKIDYANLKADLLIYGPIYNGDFEKNMAVYLREKFPNYNISYVSSAGDGPDFEEMMATGKTIDIYIGRSRVLHETMIPANMHYPMNDLMKKHDLDTGIFEDGYLDQLTIDGNVYMVPVYDSLLVMFYNKEIFDRFGVPYPRDGMSWDETLELAKEITRNENGTQYIGLWSSPTHYFRVNQKSLGFVDKNNKATIDNDEVKEIFDKLYFQTSLDPGVRARATEEWLGHDDFNRNFVIGMYVMQYGWMRTPHTSLPMDWDVVAVPTFNGDGIGSQTYANNIGIASTSDDKDAAMQVIKYLVSEEFQMINSARGDISPIKSQKVKENLFKNVEGLEGKNVQALYYNKLAPGSPVHEFDELVISEVFDSEIIPKIARGQLDLNSALREGQELADRLIQTEILRKQ
jgi:multiple sugar transport system substrate-binding protein